MPKLLLLFCITLISLSFVREKKFIPPGTVQFNDTLYIDKTEISNFGWQEFEYWTINKYGKYSKEHIAILPDTLVWKNSLNYNEPYVQYYYRHPAYKNYPVVGISYEQAKAYCQWRTDRVKAFLALGKTYKYKNFRYRLPSKDEWEMLSEFSMLHLNNKGRNKEGVSQLNCLFPIDSNSKSEVITNNASITSPVKSYQKDLLGLYNMFGNVSEMVLEEGISKGGSWRNKLEECRSGKEQLYTQPSAWLGFRCVCVMDK